MDEYMLGTSGTINAMDKDHTCCPMVRGILDSSFERCTAMRHTCSTAVRDTYQYGQSDGNGILHYASGHLREGRFLLGHWHGRGIFSIRDGSLKRKGQWMIGEPAVECSNQDIQRI